jgi:hypothetical protein
MSVFAPERVEADHLGVLCRGSVVGVLVSVGSSSGSGPSPPRPVGRGRGFEAQAEFHGGIDEGQDRVEGHAQPFGAVAEVQRDGNPSSVTSSPSYQCWMTMVISSGYRSCSQGASSTPSWRVSKVMKK